MQLCIHGLFELAWTLPSHLPYQQFVTYTANIATHTFTSTHTLATESDLVAQYIPTTTFVSLDAIFWTVQRGSRDDETGRYQRWYAEIRDEARFTGVYQTQPRFP